MFLTDWVLFALAASGIGGFSVLIDKVLITKYSKDWIYLNAFFGVINFIPALALLFFVNVFASSIFLGIISGIFFRLAALFYWKSISLEEASRVVPLFLTSPVFVLIFESLFLDERILLNHYAGMFAVIIGSFILMTRSLKGLIKPTAAFYIMILSSFIFAISEIILKFALTSSDFLPIIFWAFAGSLIASIPILMFKLKRRRLLFYKKDKLHFILPAQVVLFIAMIAAYWYAVSLGPVSLVSTLGSADGLFIFIYAIFFTKFAPTIMKEAIDKKTLLTKALAISLMVAGIFLINGGI